MIAETSRWYYWTDKLGILVWQDFPSITDTAVIRTDDELNFKQEYTRFKSFDYKTVLTISCRWMSQLYNHPSIILWVVFNEAWGQHNTVSVTENVMSLDHTRLVTGASGWTDFPVGHIADLHVYPGPSNGGKAVISIIRTKHKDINKDI